MSEIKAGYLNCNDGAKTSQRINLCSIKLKYIKLDRPLNTLNCDESIDLLKEINLVKDIFNAMDEFYDISKE